MRATRVSVLAVSSPSAQRRSAEKGTTGLIKISMAGDEESDRQTKGIGPGARDVVDSSPRPSELLCSILQWIPLGELSHSEREDQSDGSLFSHGVPNFSDCIRHTILAWAPVTFLVVFFPVLLFQASLFRRAARYPSIPWRALSIAKLVGLQERRRDSADSRRPRVSTPSSLRQKLHGQDLVVLGGSGVPLPVAAGLPSAHDGLPDSARVPHGHLGDPPSLSSPLLLPLSPRVLPLPPDRFRFRGLFFPPECPPPSFRCTDGRTNFVSTLLWSGTRCSSSTPFSSSSPTLDNERNSL